MTRLKFERLSRGWSLQTLGYHAAIQGTELSRIERRLAVPYPRQIQRLCAVLTLDPHTLLEEVSDQPVHGITRPLEVDHVPAP